tara:strand:+ start:1048 stop:1485 length:438 start_codon:yes stop_codon:yes gene_type:complete
MAEAWKVFKCLACGMAHGRKSSGHNCPHCGQRVSETTPVIDRSDNPSELRKKVVMANTPLELRESLSRKLAESEQLIEGLAKFSVKKGLSILRNLIDEDGSFTLTKINYEFGNQGFGSEVSNFIETAEAQGVIVRLGEGIWQFLE